MKAITIHQPWATLIALGEKQYETRSWPTKYRGPIAIHAATKKPDTRDIHASTVYEIIKAIRPITEKAARTTMYLPLELLPLGCIVATAELVECWKWDEQGGVLVRVSPIVEYEKVGVVQNHMEISEREKLFGGYGPGRYAWELANVQMLPEPIPAKGQQGLWNVEVPNE